jgi:hypothetical protein
MSYDDEELEELDRRPYIAITNELFEHPKFLALTPEGRLHLMRLWAYCNHYLTDGRVPAEILKKEGKRIADRLLKLGWLEPTEDPDIFMCHDYLKHQKSRAQILELRAIKSTKGNKGAHQRWHVKRQITDPACSWCIG